MPPPDERTAAIQAVNCVVASDPEMAVLLTVRDGVLLVKRKGVG